jgi:hypothetical protein
MGSSEDTSLRKDLVMQIAVFVVVFWLAIASPTCAQAWDALADFACANPNGAWSYGWRPNSWGTGFVPMTSCINPVGCPIQRWYEPAIPAMSLACPPSGGASCDTWTCPAGYLLTHPGPTTEHAVLRWTAPAAGQVSVNVTFMGIDYAYPTTTGGELMHNGYPLWGVNINSYAIPYPHAEVVTVAAGDTIEAVIGSGGNCTGDATGLALTIVLTPCPGASVTPLGAGCGPTGPQLSSTPPQIGSTVTLSVTGGPPSVFGTLYAGAPAPPLPVGNGCSVHLDIGTIFELVPIATDGTGNWSVGVYLVTDPALVGISAGLQGVVFFPAPPGLALTSAILVTIGC